MPLNTADQSIPAFLAGYRPGAGTFDELYESDGTPRSHWDYLIRSVSEMGSSEFDSKRYECERLLRESGATYNAFGRAGRNELPWPLDPLPVLIRSSEWGVIEDALIQRAELLEAILSDLYGSGRLIRDGLLPPALIYGHAGFLRPCAGLAVAAGRHLPVYSADIARGPDGSFQVLGDRAQAPSGSGYALQNRVVMTHVLPSLFRDSHVHRLRFYFRRLRAALLALAPVPDERPNMVLLTPGPDSETYFEHTFLANYLGCALVQGGDLTVIDGRVWLRTLEGRRRVDVILRRLDGGFCDPLELRSDSLLGTPGLLQAARSGNVAIANPIGCSAIENPGLMAFLPALARELLGQDLKMPSVRTWWCGDREARRYVLEHLDQLVVKPTVAHASDVTVFGPQLDVDRRARVVAEIEANPHLYVGQEYVPLSTAPVVADGGLEPRAMVLRGFVAADGDEYIVMPGGLARVASGSDSPIVSNRFGGVSKDVWVLASEPAREIDSFVRVDRPLPIRHGGPAVGGRVADNLFWVGRYSERIEVTTRILREISRLALESDFLALRAPQLRALVSAVGEVAATYPSFPMGSNNAAEGHGAELVGILADESLVGAVRGNILSMVGAARSIRDQFSYDTWRIINAIGDESSALGPALSDLAGLERLLTLLAGFSGFIGDSMTRGAAWQFLEAGRCLERALGLLSTLRGVRVSGVSELDAPWEEILAFADSQTDYQLRYHAPPAAGPVLGLLIDEDSNPRSLVFQLLRLETLLQGLPSSGEGIDNGLGKQQLLRAALAEVRNPETASNESLLGLDMRLDALLASVAGHLIAISEQLERDYFRLPEGPRLVTSFS